jgi:DNA-binding NarL/FixJ family response regulator
VPLPQPPGEAGRAAPQTGKARILIVDDSSLVRRGLTELLDSQPDLAAGAAVEAAEPALELARREPFDLAVVDICLGHMDGIELTGRLKAEHPGMMVVILSMHDPERFAERARRAGAAAFVAKQQASQILLDTIRHVLASKTLDEAAHGSCAGAGGP